MKKYVYASSVIFFLFVFYLLVQKDKNSFLNPSDSGISNLQQNTEAQSSTRETQLKGKYMTFSREVFNESTDNKRVLFFYANWCPTCRPVDQELNLSENKIPEDLVIFRVNYNDSDTDQEEKNLADDYEITYQHTFVQIDKGGKVVNKWNGGGLSELLDNIK